MCHQTTRKLTDDEDDDTVTALLHSTIDDAKTTSTGQL